MQYTIRNLFLDAAENRAFKTPPRAQRSAGQKGTVLGATLVALVHLDRDLGAY